MLLSSSTLESAFKGFRAVFKNAFDGTESFADKVAMMTTSGTSEEEYAWLGQFPALREWIGERHLHQLRAHGFMIKNRDFESTVTIPRNDLEDDKFGLYGPMFSEMGRVTKAHPDTLVFRLLKDGFVKNCYDGQFFFDTDHLGYDENDLQYSVSNVQAGTGDAWFLLDLSRAVKPIIFQKRKDYNFVGMDDPAHPNVFMRKEFVYGVDARVNVGFGLWQLAFGSKADLTKDNFVAARNAMAAFKGDKSHLLGIEPTHLIVPPSLEEDAREMLKATLGRRRVEHLGERRPAHRLALLRVSPMLVDTVLCEIQPPASDAAQWVHLFTHGDLLARDGRRFVLTDATAVVERTLARAGKAYLPIDYEHQTDRAAANGKPAPAAGWISQFAVRDNGIWALVEWTAKARAMLAAREYRYISPTFLTDQETGAVHVILRAALTNNPALELTALASAHNGESSMKLPTEITKALGLAETASVEDAVTAIKSLSGNGPEMASTLAAMAGVVKELNELKHSYGSKNVSTKVETAIKSGTIMPSLRAWATELCSSNEALFDTFIEKTGGAFAHLSRETAPDMSLLTASDAQPDTTAEGVIARQLGIDPAAMRS